MATPPTAPGLLMTLMSQPVFFFISSTRTRNMTSVPPPAAYMITTFIVCSGKPAAFASRGEISNCAVAAVAAAPARKVLRLMGVVGLVFFSILSVIVTSSLSFCLMFLSGCAFFRGVPGPVRSAGLHVSAGRAGGAANPETIGYRWDGDIVRVPRRGHRRASGAAVRNMVSTDWGAMSVGMAAGSRRGGCRCGYTGFPGTPCRRPVSMHIAGLKHA